jgi:hypothetical protein
MIYAGDSARFAMALLDYDVSQMRPHAPGYILYVGFAKLIYLLSNDVTLSLVAVSILSASFAVPALYVLANSMYGRSTAVITCLLFLSSPLFWFNSEMPLTYALEGFVSVFFALACYKSLSKDNKWLIISAILLGILTGVRQHLAFLFLPLWLYSLRKCSLRRIMVLLLAYGIVCLTWFVPMVLLTGGLTKYLTSASAQFKTWVLHPAPLSYQIRTRTNIFISFMVHSFVLGLIPMIYYLGRFFRIPRILEDVRIQFLLLWFLPAVLFFIGINLFNSGHVVCILPPFFIYLAVAITGLAKDVNEGMVKLFSGKFNLFRKGALEKIFNPGITLFFVILFFGINCLLFVYGVTQVSYSAIQQGDKKLSALVSLTKENFLPERTAILSCWLNTQAAFYLPEFRVYCPFPLIYRASEVPIESQNVYMSFRHETNPKTYWISSGFEVEPITFPDGIDTVVLWESEIAQNYYDASRPIREIVAKVDDTRIYYFKINPNEKILYDYHFLSIG